MPEVGRRISAPITLVAPITLLALGALVSLVAHQLAYLAARPLLALYPALSHGHVGHDHLSTQFAFVVPVAAIAASVVIIRWARRLGLGSDLTAARLGMVGGALFVGQESIEALAQTGGLEAMVTNPATFLGAALAPIVAVLAVVMLQQASAVVARLLEPPRAPMFPTVHALPRPVDGVDMGRLLPGSRLARGPPRVVLLINR